MPQLPLHNSTHRTMETDCNQCNVLIYLTGKFKVNFIKEKNVEGEGFEPSKPKQRIYSPSHLTALEPLQHCAILKYNVAKVGFA